MVTSADCARTTAHCMQYRWSITDISESLASTTILAKYGGSMVKISLSAAFARFSVFGFSVKRCYRTLNVSHKRRYYWIYSSSHPGDRDDTRSRKGFKGSANPQNSFLVHNPMGSTLG